jgi:hypothetical protein
MLVYLLTDPRNPRKGYVGQTRFSAARRLGDHLKAAAAAISATARKPPQHGTYSEYCNHCCRCRPCKDAAAQRSREYRARQRAG